MDVCIKKELCWMATALFLRSQRYDEIGASIRFPHETCLFWTEEGFVNFFVVLHEMNRRKLIKGISGQCSEFLNHC